MRIVYSPQATADLRAIGAYLKPRSRQGARNVRDAIRRSIDVLVDFPRIGTPQNGPASTGSWPGAIPT